MNIMKKTATILLLKNKERIYEGAKQQAQWNRIAAEFLLVSIVGTALFGLVMSTQGWEWQHSLRLVWKMLVLVWGPMLICTPSLYVFSALRGSRLTLSELVYLIVGSMATTGVVLLALAPVTWFFTWTTTTVEFIQGMNAFVIALSLAFGLLFLAKGSTFINIKYYELEKERGSRKGRIMNDVLLLWFILFLVVVLQMGEKLGPWYL